MGLELSTFHLLQGIDSGWYSLIMGLIILVVVFVCIGVCVFAVYYFSKRQERKPESKRSTLFQAFNLWAMLIQIYGIVIAIIAGAIYFFLPHLFVPSLALPVVGGVLLGVVILFVLSYGIAWKMKQVPMTPDTSPERIVSKPTECPICKKPLSPQDRFCPGCGASVE